MHSVSKRYNLVVPLFSAITVLLLLAVLTTIVCCKDKGQKTYTIGFINPNPGEKEGAQGFLRHMQKLGYIEGKNARYIKCENNDRHQMEESLNNMLAQKVDLILAMTTPAVKMAAQYTQETTIPVVAILYNAIGTGVVESLTKPGGNLTGLQLRGSTPKALEWLLAIAPDAKHLFVPVCFDTGAAKQSLNELEQGAAKTGFKLTVAEVKTVDELRTAMASIPKDIDAVFLLHSWLVGSNINIVLDHARKRKIPTLSAGHVNYDDGLLMSYGPLDDRIGSQAARLAHSILHGTPPASLPMETSGFALGINLQTAKDIGLVIPNDILQQADHISR